MPRNVGPLYIDTEAVTAMVNANQQAHVIAVHANNQDHGDTMVDTNQKPQGMDQAIGANHNNVVVGSHGNMRRKSGINFIIHKQHKITCKIKYQLLIITLIFHFFSCIRPLRLHCS